MCSAVGMVGRFNIGHGGQVQHLDLHGGLPAQRWAWWAGLTVGIGQVQDVDLHVLSSGHGEQV